ncbi:MAG: 7-cyano-7-deazaguanine synthase QueC [Candidatus Kapaibacterium sp.]
MALVGKHKAVVLVSGGMDSCLTAAYAFKKYELAFLHVNYGQRTQRRELKAFNDIAKYYGVKDKLVVDVSHFKQIGGSSLTDKNISVTKPNLKSKKIPTSYVPFRNANILAIAVSWAEVIGARAIFIGAVEEDSSGYPDCRKSFFNAYNEVIKFGTKNSSNIKIETPIINYTKKQIVQKAVRMNVPLHLTWSCYKSGTKACGDCDSCALRLRGFRDAGYQDPIIYKKL